MIDDEKDILEIMIENINKLELDKLRISSYESADDFISSVELDSSFLKDIDLIVSDYNMPETNGLRLYEILKYVGYNLKFILFSGSLKINDYTDLTFIEKPDFTKINNIIKENYNEKYLQVKQLH